MEHLGNEGQEELLALEVLLDQEDSLDPLELLGLMDQLVSQDHLVLQVLRVLKDPREIQETLALQEIKEPKEIRELRVLQGLQALEVMWEQLVLLAVKAHGVLLDLEVTQELQVQLVHEVTLDYLDRLASKDLEANLVQLDHRVHLDLRVTLVQREIWGQQAHLGNQDRKVCF